KIARTAPFQTTAIGVALTGFCFSVFLNLPQIVQQRPLSLVLMLSNLACYAFCVMVFLVFYLTRTERFFFLALLVIAIVHVLAILGIPLFPWVKNILKHTTGNLYLYPGNIHSVFRGTTVYGPFAALSALGLGLSAWKARHKGLFTRTAMALVSLLATVGCISCPSRTGLLVFLSGLFICFFSLSPKAKKLGIILLVILATGIHIAAYKNRFMRYKLGKSLPYMKKITKPSTINLKDFKIQLKDARIEISKRALQLWKSSPWFGIGPGQFNIKSGYKWQIDTHNLYAGILCEHGLVTFIPLFLLFLWLLVKFWGSVTGILLCMLGVMWCTEILIDHSCPFILGTAWLFVWTNYLDV
ncbi:MAG: hypothetical protein DSZ23_03920, partial [Thermodesulfatator sp.]